MQYVVFSLVKLVKLEKTERENQMQSDSDNIRVICYLCPIKLFYPKLIFVSLGRFTHHREKKIH